MKKRKHTQRKFLDGPILEFLMVYGWAIIAVLFIVSAFLYFGKIGTANWKLQKLCEYEPDKCVLEPTKKFLTSAIPIKYNSLEEYCKNHPVEYIPKDYCQARKKTQEELQTEADIKSCNNNPREDEKCKCKEKTKQKEPLHLNMTLYTEETLTIFDGITDLDILEQYKFDDIYDYEIMELSGEKIYYPFNTTTNLDNRLWGKRWSECAKTEEVWIPTKWDGNKITEMKKEYKEDSSECTPILYQITFYDTSEPNCIKSRPKFDYEKHPDNYTREIKVVLNEEWINNCCENVTINIGDNRQTYIANKICFEADSEAFSQINTINVSKCQATPKFINKTTYRLKNECEKGEKTWTTTLDIFCNSTEFSPITGFNVTEEDLKIFQDYGYNCSISNEYKSCDSNE